MEGAKTWVLRVANALLPPPPALVIAGGDCLEGLFSMGMKAFTFDSSAIQLVAGERDQLLKKVNELMLENSEFSAQKTQLRIPWRNWNVTPA